jgi:HD-GYP domain-containing protein (c-di-GMP phosphodiesterase class II)
VIKHIRELSGKQFDPEVVDAFLQMMQERSNKATRKKSNFKK